MKEIISIIIPIYNSEQYLKKCICSIINQTYKNLEILLINDGSTDKSEKICLEIKKKDNRIKYIYKENSGVSDTRNYGIKLSKGNYILFIDSDDYIDNDYIEKMYKKSKEYKVDIVVSGLTQVDINDNYIKKSLYTNIDKKLALNDYIDVFINYSYFTCVKMLIKKSIIKEIKFDNKLKYGEDCLFAYNLFKNNDIVYTNICGYYYVQNQDSMTHDTSIEAMETYIDNTNYLLNQILLDYPNKKETIDNRMMTKLNIALLKLNKNNKIKYKIIKNFAINNKKKLNISKVNISKINYISKANIIRIYLLHYNLYYIYYSINKIINFYKKANKN